MYFCDVGMKLLINHQPRHHQLYFMLDAHNGATPFLFDV